MGQLGASKKLCLSSDQKLQLIFVKMELLVIANENVAVKFNLSFVHTARHITRMIGG